MDIAKIARFEWPDATFAWDEDWVKNAFTVGGTGEKVPADPGIRNWACESHPEPPTMDEIRAASKLVGFKNRQLAEGKKEAFRREATHVKLMEAILEDRKGNPELLDKIAADYEAAK